VNGRESRGAVLIRGRLNDEFNLAGPSGLRRRRSVVLSYTPQDVRGECAVDHGRHERPPTYPFRRPWTPDSAGGAGVPRREAAIGA